MTPLIKQTESYSVSIFIAGDYESAKRICRQYCDDTGFCVTVTKTEYVYTRGQESGIIVGLINYPRFPSDKETMLTRATDIANLLREKLNQESFSIQTPEKTIWHSYRKEDTDE